MASYRQKKLHKPGAERMGLGEGNVQTVMGYFKKWLVPVLYPDMVRGPQAMCRGEWRELWKSLDKVIVDTFTTPGQKDVAEAARKAAEQTALQNGSSALVAAAIALKAGTDALKSRKAQTEPSQTRCHITEAEASQVRDLLLCEPFRRNRALVLDANLALVEGTGVRPSSVAATAADKDEVLSLFHDSSPFTLGDVTISPIGPNGGSGIEVAGGIVSYLQVSAMERH